MIALHPYHCTADPRHRWADTHPRRFTCPFCHAVGKRPGDKK